MAAAARVTAGVGPEFVREHTELMTAPLVPEIRLHLSRVGFPLWARTEELLGTGQPPFWAFAWAGGQALARYVLDHPEVVRGRNVLDLAAGSGLVAIAAVMAGAGHVLASEVDVIASVAMDLNAAANGVELRQTQDVLQDAAPDFEVVLAGDVLYERAMAARVMPFLERAAARGALVLIGDPDRDYLPRERFDPLWTVEVPVPRSIEDSEVKRTTVWQLRAAGA